jgi:hypothetical protein
VDIRQAAPRSGHPAGLGRFFGVAVVVNFEGASPSMMGIDPPDFDLRALAYQAIED